MAVEPLTLDLDVPRAAQPLLHRFGRRLQEYVLLTRANRPIGIWLLLWPTLWALWIAGDGRPRQSILVIFLAGTAVMRSAGCIANDLADRNVDPYVRRTRERPLAARRVTPLEAFIVFLVLAACAAWLATLLDAFTLRLALIGAALTASYPFFKRFFPLPQMYLGLAFGWGVPMAFGAEIAALPRIAWLLFIAAILWTVVYDTLYAMVDRDDDVKIGVKSSATLFADLDRLAVAALQLMALAALWLVGRSLHFGHWYEAGLAAAALLFAYQQWLIRARDPIQCLRAFHNNNYVGMVVFIGIMLQYLYR